MNQFELFCMVFYALDAQWDESQDPQLGEFLSSANPFLFEDIGSADPAVYSDFCQVITEPITLENSYELATQYIATLWKEVIAKAFSGIEQDEWMECVQDYLAGPHKGA